MTSLSPKWIIWGIVGAFIFILNFIGIQWGLPSQTRSNILFGRESPHEIIYQTMGDLRKRLVDINNGAPLAPEETEQALVPGQGINHSLFRGQIIQKVGSRVPPSIIRVMGSYLIRSKLDDEANVLAALAQIDIRKGRLFGKKGVNYGALYLYPMGAALVVADKLNFLQLKNDVSFYYRQPWEMAKMLGIMRIYNAALSLFIFPAIFILTNRLFNKRAAVMASIIWSCTSYQLFISHVVKPHVLSSGLILLSLSFSFLILNSKEDKRSWYVWSGFWAGTGMGIGANVAPFALFLPLAAVLKYRRSIFAWRHIKNMSLYGGVALASALILGWPWLFTSPQIWLTSIQGGKVSPNADMIGWAQNWFHCVSLALGWPLVILSGLGVCTMIFKKNPAQWLLAWFLIFYWVLMNKLFIGVSQDLYDVKFFAPAVVLMAVIGIAFLFHMETYVNKWFALTIQVLMLGYYGLQGVGQAVNFYRDSSASSSYLQTGDWINKNIPSGSSLGLMDFPVPDMTPPFDFRFYQLQIGLLDQFQSHHPDYYLLIKNKGGRTGPQIPSSHPRDFLNLYQEHWSIQPFLSRCPLFLNPYAKANYPYWIYKRKAAASA